MSTLPDFSRQYQPPKIPTYWSADERRFAQGVTDVLDDIYLRYGRLSKKDLSPALSKEILDASGNIVQLQLDTSGLTTRMLSAEGSLSTLEQTATLFDTRISNAEGDISIAQQQADKIQWLVASGTSAANMTLTSQLYSLMAANIDLSANNSIKLAVGGIYPGADNAYSLDKTNIQFSGATIVNPAKRNDIRGLSFTSNGAGLKVARVLGVIDSNGWWVVSGRLKGNALSSTSHYVTIDICDQGSQKVYYAAAGAEVWFEVAVNVTNYGSNPSVYNFVDIATDLYVYVEIADLVIQKGNKASGGWVPSSKDPASGVKTSKVTIDTNGVAIATGGVFTVSSGNFAIDASGNVTMKGHVEATSGKIGGFTLSNGKLTSNSGFLLDPTLTLPQMAIKYLNMGSTSNGAYLTCTFTEGYSAFDIQNPYGFVSIRGGRSNQWGGSLTLSRDVNGLKLAQISDKLQVSDTVYIENNCSALSFTDRTPAYTGNALDELRWVRGNRAQGIDHNSIPPFARKTIQNTRTLPDGTVEHYHEPGRDLGAMISILTKAVQEIDDRMNAFERRLPA